jgi:CysZ protein
MLTDLTRAFQQLNDPAVQRLLLYCAGGALVVFAGLTVLCGVVLFALDPTGMVLVDVLRGALGFGAALVLAWLLFPVTVALVLSFFLEDVVEAVERRYYPDLPPVAEGWGRGETAWATLRFVALALLLNLLALPLYLLPGPNVLSYLALNGYLLGREYFELVAQRRTTAPETRRMRREARGGLFAGGLFIAAMLTVPLFNLVAPVVATAFMVHRFERLRRRRRRGVAAGPGVPAPESAKAVYEPGDRRV